MAVGLWIKAVLSLAPVNQPDKSVWMIGARKVKVHDEARAMVMGETDGIKRYPRRRQRKVRKRPAGVGKLRTVTQVIEVVGVEGCSTFEPLVKSP